MLLSFCLMCLAFNAQKLKCNYRRLIRTTIDSMKILDQQYREPITYGFHELAKLDSIEKLPVKLFSTHLHRNCIGEIGFSKEIKDSLWRLQKVNDSLNKRLLKLMRIS